MCFSDSKRAPAKERVSHGYNPAALSILTIISSRCRSAADAFAMRKDNCTNFLKNFSVRSQMHDAIYGSSFFLYILACVAI